MPFDATPTEIVVESKDIRIMRKIRDEIASGHWCKGNFTIGQNHCILGWWNELDYSARFPQVHPICTYLGLDIVQINDDPKTTKEDMVALLDAAIWNTLHTG